MQHVLIIGATSAIAEHVARLLAAAGAALYLTGRDGERLDAIAADLRVRGAARVVTDRVDITDSAARAGLIERAASALGGLDSVILAAGSLPEQARAQDDAHLLAEAFDVNAIGPMAILHEGASYLARQGHGQLVAIGSVAGDRGRATNYVYGAAKGALEIFMSGLRQRLQGSGVKVLLVKPGFVDTPMTAAFDKGPLWTSPQRVARDLVRAMEHGRAVLYTPWYWRWIMRVIRALPEPLFVRLRF